MTSNPGPAPRILGRLRSAPGNTGAVRMDDHLGAGPGEVWLALTDPHRLACWYGEIEGDLRPGGEFRVRVYDSGLRIGRVRACEAARRLLVTMRDPRPRPGQPGTLEFEIQLTGDDGRATHLAAEIRGMPVPLLAAYGAGVQTHVEDLAAHLAGQERGDADARFDELLPAYQDLAADVG